MPGCGLVLDPVFEQHRTSAGHPERPERQAAIAAVLEQAGWARRCPRIAPRPATDAELLRIHTRDYIDRLMAACRDGEPLIDSADSAICPISEQIARLAAGAVIDAARAVASGELTRAFCAVRPPGHHAEAEHSMGFCLYNNIALAAAACRAELGQGGSGLARVAIVDWDVHHGNGTQHSFDADPHVLFISLHGHPDYLYPGTGAANERGRGAGLGYTINIPLLPGTLDDEYREAVCAQVLPALERFAPELILISAGFDAHRDDPLGNLRLSTETFGWFTDELVRVAERSARGRLVSVLEGGYDLESLGACVSLHVARLFETGGRRCISLDVAEE